MVKTTQHKSFGKMPPEWGVRQEGGRSGGKIEWRLSKVNIMAVSREQNELIVQNGGE